MPWSLASAFSGFKWDIETINIPTGFQSRKQSPHFRAFNFWNITKSLGNKLFCNAGTLIPPKLKRKPLRTKKTNTTK